MTTKITQDYSNLLALLDRPIAFHRVFVTISGSVLAGLMLSQAVYWTPRTSAEGNWFYKTQAEWEEETGMTRWEQEGARKKLLQVKSPSGGAVWEEERRGVPAKMWYRVNVQALFECILECGDAAIKNVEIPHTGVLDNHNLESGKATDKSAGKSQSLYTETTTDISAKKGVRPTQAQRRKDYNAIPDPDDPDHRKRYRVNPYDKDDPS